MSGEKRREKMLEVLRGAKEPVSGAALAEAFAVSRQIIVQDIALLRAQKQEIISTCRGYIMKKDTICQRIFKVHHSDEAMEEELNLYESLGITEEKKKVYCAKINDELLARRLITVYIKRINSRNVGPTKKVNIQEKERN